MDETSAKALELHRQYQGKLEFASKAPIDHASLALLYTPGVGAVSRAITKSADQAPVLTMSGRTVAVISDGSAVLGLGNVGPLAAMPVMEGKAVLFKHFAGVDAMPIVLDTQDPAEIVATIKHIAPTFAGINLEDISAPRCYEIERRLQKELPIPVVHDDQHATAIVALAGLINAAKITARDLKHAKVVVVGAGAAGSGIVRLLKAYGVDRIRLFDSKGLVRTGRAGLDAEKHQLAQLTDAQDDVSLNEAVQGADVLIGVSMPDSFTAEQVATMAPDAIVFALANPDPEIMPDVAKKAGATVVATGRSDFPNQINNVLIFPGLFKGLLASRARDLTIQTRIRAAEALAALVHEPAPDRIIPSVFDEGVVLAVSGAVASL